MDKLAQRGITKMSIENSLKSILGICYTNRNTDIK